MNDSALKPSAAVTRAPDDRAGDRIGRQPGHGWTEWLDMAGMAFVLVDAALRIDSLSPGAGTLLGLPAARIGGEVEEAFRQLGGEALVEDLRDAVTSHSPAQRQLTTAQGRRFLVRILPRPLQDGDRPGAVIACVDVTERGSPETGRGDLDQTDLIAIASHDLRQPLQSISLLNSALLQVTDRDRIRRIVRLQRESLDQVSDLLESLLDLSTLNSGTVRPEITRFPMARILDRLRADFREPAAEKGLNFDVRNSDEIVECDQILLIQMLENLVANAIRRTNRGFVRLRCRAVRGQLEVSLEYSPGVSDPESPDQGSGLETMIAWRIARLLAIPIETRRKRKEDLRVIVRIPVPAAPLNG